MPGRDRRTDRNTMTNTRGKPGVKMLHWHNRLRQMATTHLPPITPNEIGTTQKALNCEKILLGSKPSLHS